MRKIIFAFSVLGLMGCEDPNSGGSQNGALTLAIKEILSDGRKLDDAVLAFLGEEEVPTDSISKAIYDQLSPCNVISNELGKGVTGDQCPLSYWTEEPDNGSTLSEMKVKSEAIHQINRILGYQFKGQNKLVEEDDHVYSEGTMSGSVQHSKYGKAVVDAKVTFEQSGDMFNSSLSLQITLKETLNIAVVLEGVINDDTIEIEATCTMNHAVVDCQEVFDLFGDETPPTRMSLNQKSAMQIIKSKLRL